MNFSQPRKPYTPFEYQERMIDWLYTNKEAALFCSPGLGKTGTTLKAFDQLSYDCATKGMLVIAPIRVGLISWPSEVAKWGFASWMTIANLRTAEGIRHWENGTADIYVINSEALPTREMKTPCKECWDGRKWEADDGMTDPIFVRADTKTEAWAKASAKLDDDFTLCHHDREGCPTCNGDGFITTVHKGFVAKYLKGKKPHQIPVDLLVIDELSLAKSAKSKRFNALRAWRDLFKFKWGLTGTPAPNTYADLWAQIRFLDDGKRFGHTFSGYRDRYFGADGTNRFAKYSLKRGAKEQIENKISDLCLTMLSEDYLDVPTCSFTDVEITLCPKARKEYTTLKKELLLEIESGEIEALNAAALTAKLLQITGGAVYDADKKVHVLHDAKIKALKELVKKHKGEPLLVLTQFKHERSRLLDAIPGSKLFHERDMDLWKSGKIPVWIADPRSMSHGIDGMQHGGRIAVWFTQTYSNETYIQTNARLVRTGQSYETIIYRLIALDTVDEAVVEALREKDTQQNGLFLALRNLQLLEKASKQKKAS